MRRRTRQGKSVIRFFDTTSDYRVKKKDKHLMHGGLIASKGKKRLQGGCEEENHLQTFTKIPRKREKPRSFETRAADREKLRRKKRGSSRLDRRRGGKINFSWTKRKKREQAGPPGKKKQGCVKFPRKISKFKEGDVIRKICNKEHFKEVFDRGIKWWIRAGGGNRLPKNLRAE